MADVQKLFEGVPFILSARGSGKYHKVQCPDCVDYGAPTFIHFEPDTDKPVIRRKCRVCAAKWVIAVGSRIRGEIDSYTMKRLRAGSRTPGIDGAPVPTSDSIPTPTPDDAPDDAPNLDSLKGALHDISTTLQTHFESECNIVKSDAFAGFLKEATAEALKIAMTAAAKVSPVERVLVAPVTRKVKLSGDRHCAYDEVLAVSSAIGNVLMVGPAGSGKSSLAQQMAKDLGFDYGYLSCTEGLSEAHILGRMDMTGSYIPSDFITCFETDPKSKLKGAVFLLDEIDAMDANTALVINEALANGIISVPSRVSKPLATKRKNLIILCAANTYGTGADTSYVGRNRLDAAFLDRFSGAIVDVGYDLDRERSIGTTYGIEAVVPIVQKIRANVIQNKVSRPVSTRWLLGIGKLYLQDPKTFPLNIGLARCFAGWSDTEKAKALQNIDLSVLSA